MKTLQELQQIRDKMKSETDGRSAGAASKYRAQVLVCGGTGCSSGGGKKISEGFADGIKANKLESQVKLVTTGCFGLCAIGPVVVIYPDGVMYSQVAPSDVDEIISQHLIKGEPVKRLLYKCDTQSADKFNLNETAFFKKQLRMALRNCGRIDPENIDEYLSFDGYKAYEKAVTQLSPQEVIDILKKSGLKGRGGAGFPAGAKWQFAADSVSNQKYVVCNADEGDPGAFMDRSILEGDPHAVIESMMLAGFAIGANQGYVYVRAEYPLAVHRLRVAIKQAEEYGILGNNAMGLGKAFNIQLRLGAGAFVCGEETALIASVEGQRGEPRQKPPFPAVKGLFGQPTLINNVETLANIPQIILNGAEWFAAIGTEKSKGTKVFALGGKITNTGLVEVPIGTTLRTVIEEIGAGIPNGKKFKAAQTGGPSGGCIPASLIDTPIDYDTLVQIGSMMGSGGLIVMDEDNCMVDIAKFFLQFTLEESCGKCTPCRIGNKRLLEMLNKVTDGKAEKGDLEKIEKLGNYIKANSLCALGQTAPNPVLSTIKYFRSEYEAHINDKVCPAKVCQKLINYNILPQACIGCGLCKRACPADAISGEVKSAHIIDAKKCLKCGACVAKCPKKAIIKG